MVNQEKGGGDGSGAMMGFSFSRTRYDFEGAAIGAKRAVAEWICVNGKGREISTVEDE